MIWIFHREIADAASVGNYDELHAIITKKENLKLLRPHAEYGQMPWSFTFFTSQQVSIIYADTPQALRTEVLKEAYKKGMGLVAMCQGDFGNPLEILGTSDIDIKALKKQWCLGYCDIHGYTVVENPPYLQSDSFAQFQGESRRDHNCQ